MKKKSLKEKKQSRDVLPDSVEEAIEHGDVERLEATMDLKDEGADKTNVNAVDADGDSALFLAAHYGHDNTIVRLLKCSNIDVNAQNQNGNSALIHAACKGQDQAVALLLGVCRY